MTLHHICIQTDCYQQSLEFYTKVLRMELVQETPDFHTREFNTWLKLGAFMIELITPKKGAVTKTFNKNTTGLVHFCLLVECIELEYQRIKHMEGVKFQTKNGADIYEIEGGRLLKLIAPEGTIIELRENNSVMEISLEKHEVVYQKLKSKGYNGWGGDNYNNRMASWDEYLDILFDRIDLAGNHVLEMGCGAGDISLKMQKKGFKVTGIDISPTAIDWAIEKNEGLESQPEFLTASVSNPKILDGREFDLIVDGNCLHCLFEDERVGFYDNVLRLLKRDGYFYVSSAILCEKGAPIPILSSIPRCVMTEEDLHHEIEAYGFNRIQSWVTKHGTHHHYRGLYQKKI